MAAIGPLLERAVFGRMRDANVGQPDLDHGVGKAAAWKPLRIGFISSIGVGEGFGVERLEGTVKCIGVYRKILFHQPSSADDMFSISQNEQDVDLYHVHVLPPCRFFFLTGYALQILLLRKIMVDVSKTRGLKRAMGGSLEGRKW